MQDHYEACMAYAHQVYVGNSSATASRESAAATQPAGSPLQAAALLDTLRQRLTAGGASLVAAGGKAAAQQSAAVSLWAGGPARPAFGLWQAPTAAKLGCSSVGCLDLPRRCGRPPLLQSRARPLWNVDQPAALHMSWRAACQIFATVWQVADRSPDTLAQKLCRCQACPPRWAKC